MGDRGNIVIREDWPDDLGPKEAVFLYSHWGGFELPETLRKALIRGKGRWDDGIYLARIIFNEMTRGETDGTTGYGISTRLTDNEYDLIVLLPDKEQIALITEDEYNESGFAALDDAPYILFEDYIAVERNWGNLNRVVASG